MFQNKTHNPIEIANIPIRIAYFSIQNMSHIEIKTNPKLPTVLFDFETFFSGVKRLTEDETG